MIPLLDFTLEALVCLGSHAHSLVEACCANWEDHELLNKHHLFHNWPSHKMVQVPA